MLTIGCSLSGVGLLYTIIPSKEHLFMTPDTFAVAYFEGATVQVVEMIFFGASQRGLVYLYRDVPMSNSSLATMRSRNRHTSMAGSTRHER